ncbi:hypothetical protein HJFPF1_07080 [Paramyrothecium foliicola]|nr:hypothetical protein HJFPF1_07080 [Paramyrothecium foliicola]
MSHKVALIFGVGPNIGQSVAKALKAKGYKIALASRSLKSEDSAEDELHIPTDASSTEAIEKAFGKVQAAFACAYTPNNPTDLFEVPVDVLKKSTAVNLFSSYAAAQQAVRGWETLSDPINATFIFTGNCQNVIPITALMDLGPGKAGSASFIQAAAESYKDKGYKFYYADERLEDGTPMFTGLSGKGHAKHYVELTEDPQQRPWLQTFTTGIGYKTF